MCNLVYLLIFLLRCVVFFPLQVFQRIFCELFAFWADAFQIYLNCWDFVLIFIMCFEVFADSQNSTMEIVFSCSKVTEPLWLILAAKLHLLLESLTTKAMVSPAVSTPLLNFRSLLRKISLGPLLKLGIPWS